jgi:hypothetical protein
MGSDPLRGTNDRLGSESLTQTMACDHPDNRCAAHRVTTETRVASLPAVHPPLPVLPADLPGSR